MKSRRHKWIVGVTAAVFLLLCFLSSTILTYRTSEYIIDSDASSELLLGKVLSEDGGVLSKNWYYSTELRVLNTQLVYASLFHLFDDWRTVRWVGQTLLNAMLMLSFLYMSKRVGIRRPIRLVCAGVLLLPMSTIYARIVLMHGYYVPHIVIAFCLLGLFYSLTREKNGRMKIWVTVVSYLLLSFGAGLGGIRQIAVSGIPLVAVMLYEFLVWGRMQGTVCLCTEEYTLNTSSAKNRIFVATMGLLALVFGYLTYSFLLTRIYTIAGDEMFVLGLPNLHLIKKVIRSCMKLFGYHAGAKIISIEGIASGLGLVSGLICILLTLRFMIRKRYSQDWRIHSAGLMLAVTASVLAVIMLLTGKDEARYLLPAIGFLPLLIAVVWEQAERQGHRLYRWTAIMLIVCCVANGAVINRYFIKEHCGETVQTESCIVYEGIEVSEIDLVRDMLPVAEFLAESGYRYGYTEFWRGNIVTELTDGAVEMVIFSPEEYHTPTIYNWLSRQDLFDRARDEERVFLLMEVWDYEAALIADGGWLPLGKPIYEDKQFIVFDMLGDNALAQLLANGV